jgi:hypothetical protein
MLRHLLIAGTASIFSTMGLSGSISTNRPDARKSSVTICVMLCQLGPSGVGSSEESGAEIDNRRWVFLFTSPCAAACCNPALMTKPATIVSSARRGIGFIPVIVC